MDASRQPDEADVAASGDREARGRLASLPGFSRELADNARLTRLVGFTNRVYKVEREGQRVCLRIPGSGGAAAAIDRRAEEINARLAAAAGVAPEVLYFGADGVMLTRFVEGGLPLRPERIASSEGALERGAVALRRLHQADINFTGTFRAFATIDAYAAALERLAMPLSADQRETVHNVQAIGRALAAHPARLKPCHCDPTGRNLLDMGERVWLVDWEYSGMNDPMWDLAYFSVESLLDEQSDRRLLAAYFGGNAPAREAARMAVLKPVCETLAALWALIQAAEGRTGGDFSGYASASFARAAERIGSDEFHRQLKSLET